MAAFTRRRMIDNLVRTSSILGAVRASNRAALLERFTPAHRPADLTDKQDHRSRVLTTDMEPGRGVGGTGPTRCHDDAGLAAELAPGFRHHRSSAFLAANSQRNRRVVECVQER